MAVIARSVRAALLILASALPALPRETEGQELYRQVSHIATALTSRNASDAMTPFDKAFPKYERLQDYFTGLTNAYEVNSELQIVDQKIEGSAATLVVGWSLTLSDPESTSGENRSEEVTVHFALKNGKWKIVDFSPIALFDPQPRAAQLAAR